MRQVDGQGEVIRRIEYHVDLASDYVKPAVRDTSIAYEHRLRRRRKVRILIGFASVICLIAVWFIGSKDVLGFW